jgi:hypothetical protein
LYTISFADIGTLIRDIPPPPTNDEEEMIPEAMEG